MKHSASRKGFRGAITSLMVMACVVAASTGALAANKLIVQDNAAVPNDKFVVSDTGRVGLGTTAPLYPIHIVAGGPTSTTTLEFRNTGNTTYSVYDAPQIQLVRNNISTVNSGIPKNNDRLGAFQFGSYFGSTIRYAAGIFANAEGSTWTSTSYPGYLSFMTTSATGTYPSERIRIASTGNVGIGTSTPMQRLELNGGLLLNAKDTQPACDSVVRGTIWYTRAAVSSADKIEVCVKLANENYAWTPLF